MSVTDWLLDADPAERARVEHAGWGARLLALEDPDGLWASGACFPASYTGVLEWWHGTA